MRMTVMVTCAALIGGMALTATTASAQEWGGYDGYSSRDEGYNFANGSRQDRARAFQNRWAAREAAEHGDYRRARIYDYRSRLLSERSRRRAYDARSLGYGDQDNW